MLSNLKQLFNRSNKDLRKRIYFTLFCLAVFCFGSNITVPWEGTIYEELPSRIFSEQSGTSFSTPVRTAKLALNDMMEGIL